MDTLQCFASGPITQSLEELAIGGAQLPPSELSHLFALRRLRTLHLHFCFSPHLDDDTEPLSAFGPFSSPHRAGSEVADCTGRVVLHRATGASV